MESLPPLPLAVEAPKPQAPSAAVAPASSPLDTIFDAAVAPAGCASCGGFHGSLDGPQSYGSYLCNGAQCVPGRAMCTPPCYPCNTLLGQFFTCLYEMICCPDPCYQPQWEPGANASLFADYARPRTVTRFRYDNLINITRPDRNQFFVQQVHGGKNFKFGGVTYRSDPAANLQQIYLYQEAAGDFGSLWVEMPYRQFDPLFSPLTAGFSDLNFGLKSLLLDREVLQISFQFRTFVPTGDGGKGLGTQHVSLDPSFLASLKLTPSTYFQAQIGQWIPLSGTPNLAGGVLYWFLSLNQVLFNVMPNSPLIATLEMDGWSFENGGYTQPIAVNAVGKSTKTIQGAGGGVSYFNIGPGLRWSICNRFDIGSAITFATTANHWGDPWYRFEMRWLF
jgi:hypothetical protein